MKVTQRSPFAFFGQTHKREKTSCRCATSFFFSCVLQHAASIYHQRKNKSCCASSFSIGSAMANIQQRLLSSCQNPIDPNNEECLVLKHILDELKVQDKQYLVDAEDETHRSPVFHAIESGKPLHYLRLLLEFPVRLTSRVLLCAIRNGDIDLLQLLHEYGADFRETHHGLTLLHECILLHKNHLIQFLIDKGEVGDIR
jgi:ankyrin repeat protein